MKESAGSCNGRVRRVNNEKTMVACTIHVYLWQYMAILEQARSSGVSRAKIIRDAITEYLEKRKCNGECNLASLEIVSEEVPVDITTDVAYDSGVSDSASTQAADVDVECAVAEDADVVDQDSEQDDAVSDIDEVEIPWL